MEVFFKEIWNIFNDEKNQNISDSEKENLLMDVIFRMRKQINTENKTKIKKEFELLLNDF